MKIVIIIVLSLYICFLLAFSRDALSLTLSIYPRTVSSAKSLVHDLEREIDKIRRKGGL